jgi:hypothetical protein
MKTIALAILFAVGALAVAVHAAHAAPSTHGALVATDAGLADAGVTPVPGPTITAPDPIDHPKDAYDAELAQYKQGGLLVSIVFGLYMLGAALGKRATPGSLLDRGRLAVVIAAVTSTSLSVLLALTHQVGWPVAIAGTMVAWAAVLDFHVPKPGALKAV